MDEKHGQSPPVPAEMATLHASSPRWDAGNFYHLGERSGIQYVCMYIRSRMYVYYAGLT